MSSIWLSHNCTEGGQTPCKCDDCGKVMPADEVDVIRSAEQRLEPGGEVPAGECPDCGSLAYVVKPDPVLENPIKEALQNLVNLKDYKDEHGKDDFYLYAQPGAWDAARACLTTNHPPCKDFADAQTELQKGLSRTPIGERVKYLASRASLVNLIVDTRIDETEEHEMKDLAQHLLLQRVRKDSDESLIEEAEFLEIEADKHEWLKPS